MTQRTKLELPLNQPVQITLLYDEPVSGLSKYGAYHLFAVSVGDDEFSFFAPDDVFEQIKHLRRGDSFSIIKLAAQRGNKLVTSYEVTMPVNAEINSFKQANESDLPEAISPQPDKYFNVMLQCYRDALEISKELNGMADPEKIAVTLFIARSKQSY